MSVFTLKVNGRTHSVDVDPATPLLYVLSDDLELRGPKFGCGLSQCGTCTVNIKGQAVRSCVTTVGSLDGSEITTLEGLGSPERPHPLQQAFIDEQAMQCGYCIPGFIMTSVALLDRVQAPDRPTIREALSQNMCRCGTYQRIVRAVERAAQSNGR